MYYIFSFKSRQEAIRLSDSAQNNGVSTMIVSTPYYVKNGCGLSVRVEENSFSALYQLLCSMRFSTFLGAYKISGENGKNVVKVL